MDSFSYSKLIFFYLIIICINIKNIYSITNDILKTIEGNINENTIELDIKKIITEYEQFNEKYENLVREQDKNKNKEDYDRFVYKKEYKKLFDVCEIFYEYFYRQRKRLSDFINKPTGKVPEQVIHAYNTIAEYVLESNSLIKELGEKSFIDNPEL